MKKSNYYFLLILFFVSVCIGIYFRFYNVENTTLFAGDQGSDLLVAEDILKGNLRLLGPFLGVAEFFGPPTYYYLLAVFLAISKDPVVVTALFGLLNLLTVAISFSTYKLLFGKRTAFLMMCLLLVLAQFIEQSKMIWQPWLSYFFLSLSVYLLVLSTKRSSSLLHLSSVFTFAAACSSYLAPMLLIPWFLLNSYYFFSKTIILRKGLVIQQLFLVYFCCFSFIYLPQFFYEYQNNFPFVTALTSGSFSAQNNSALGILETLWMNIDVFSTRLLRIKTVGFLVLLSVITAVWYLYKDVISKIFSEKKISPSLFNIYSIWIGIFLLFFYRGSIHGHRLIAFLPILFLHLSLLLFLGQKMRKTSLKLIAAALYCYIYVTNVVFSYYYIPQHTTTKDFRDMSAMALEIIDSNNRKKNDKVEFHAYTPYDAWNYELSPLLFYIRKNLHYPVKFNKPGNDLIYRGDITVSDYYYLFCIGFKSESDMIKNCLDVFTTRTIERTKENVVIHTQLPITQTQYLYILKPN